MKGTLDFYHNRELFIDEAGRIMRMGGDEPLAPVSDEGEPFETAPLDGWRGSMR
ncbi:MAG: hypothetical protein RXS42_07425 [Nitrososphaeria archaeon]